MEARTIIIRAAGGAFSTTVEPPIEGADYSATYTDIRKARGYASGLKFTLGLKVLDMTGEVAR